MSEVVLAALLTLDPAEYCSDRSDGVMDGICVALEDMIMSVESALG